MTLTARACACGLPLVPSVSGNFLICTHCDMPSLHKAETCEQCRRIKIPR